MTSKTGRLTQVFDPGRSRVRQFKTDRVPQAKTVMMRLAYELDAYFEDGSPRLKVPL